MVWNFQDDLGKIERRIMTSLLEGYDGHEMEFIREDGNFNCGWIMYFNAIKRLEELGYIRIEDAPFEESYIYANISIIPKVVLS